MPIRFAIPEDIPALVQLGKRMHSLTRFRRYDYDERRVAAALRLALVEHRARYGCFVAEGAGGELAGALLAVLERHIFSEALVASVMHFDVLPEKRMGGHAVRLLAAMEKWAANRGVAEIAFGVNSGVGEEAVNRFARKAGFVPVGNNFVKLLGSPRACTGGERE